MRMFIVMYADRRERAMQSYRISYLLISFLVMALVAVPVRAAEETPKQVIMRTADQLLTVIEEGKAYYSEDPQRFYNNVSAVLEPAVDMKRFAAGVMGKYFRLSSSEQRQRFLETFQNSLIRTYARGLLAFSNESIRVLDPRAPSRDPERDSVEMELVASDGTVYPIIYSMRKGNDSRWRITNVTVNGINLGLTFRNQFDSAMTTHNRDFDYVIDHWMQDESAPALPETLGAPGSDE